MENFEAPMGNRCGRFGASAFPMPYRKRNVASDPGSAITLRRGPESSGDYVSSEHRRSGGGRRRCSWRPFRRLRRWVGHQFTSPLTVDRQGGHRSGHDPDVPPIRNCNTGDCGGVVQAGLESSGAADDY
jgi:hypothetical protein